MTTPDPQKEPMKDNARERLSFPKNVIEAKAREWGCSLAQMERLSLVIAERGGSMTDDDAADLDLVAIAYSRACSIHECSFWLPFDVMPGWQDDVFCILEDEDAWFNAVNWNQSISDLAERLLPEAAR